jgi:6-phosphogluconolactonase
MKKKIKDIINIQPDPTGISHFAADEFVRLSDRAIKNDGKFTVVLAGGNTPGELYRLLASDEYNSQVDWENVYFFFGDERDVSPASNQSNFNMVNVLLFKPLKTPKTNIFRWQTEIINAPGVAIQYEKYIRKFFKIDDETFPKFDLTLLGMGDDGHTASLFPHSPALDETEKIAVANLINQRKSYRLTMTYPALNNSENVIFLVSGESKAKTLQKVLEGDHEPEKLPAQGIQPASGNLLWLVDETAAECLT